MQREKKTLASREPELGWVRLLTQVPRLRTVLLTVRGRLYLCSKALSAPPSGVTSPARSPSLLYYSTTIVCETT